MDRMAGSLDDAQRQTVLRLLAEEEAKLAALLSEAEEKRTAPPMRNRKREPESAC